jgi:hypothetical protein
MAVRPLNIYYCRYPGDNTIRLEQAFHNKDINVSHSLSLFSIATLLTLMGQ